MLLTGRFNIIEHKFLEPGHTYLDSDRDFEKVETAVKHLCVVGMQLNASTLTPGSIGPIARLAAE